MSEFCGDNEIATVEPQCPRCGYDLRGIMSAWGETCPLEGTCTECGLQFEWAAVLRPEKFEPLWCVEFAPQRRRVPRACGATALRVLWPWRFWTRMQMGFAVHWLRLWVYTLFLAILIMLTFVASQAAVGVLTWLAVASQADEATAMIIADTEDQFQALQRAKQNAPENDTALHAYYEVEINLVEQQRAAPWKSMPTVWQAAWWSVSAPWNGATPSGYSYLAPTTARQWWAQSNVVRQSFPPPVEQRGLLAEHVDPQSRRAPYEMALLYMVLQGVGWVALTLGMPLLFVLIPISRRRAKVRWRHVWRVVLYSLTGPAIGFMACAIASTIMLASAYTYQWSPLAVYVIPWIVVAWIIATWATAIGRYMKIPHAWAVAVVFAVLSIAVPLVTVAWIGIWLSSPY